MPRSTSSAKKPRVRRDAEEARAAILDAAEKRLVSAGPAGIRLQEVAQDVGMSHPTVLHHFGSREALVKAVITRAIGGIHERLIEVSRTSTADEGQVAAMMDGVFQALNAGGYGRMILWLALEGQMIDASPVPLADVVDALHAMGPSADNGVCRSRTREDTAHAVVLAALALVGSTVLGPDLLGRAGLATDAAAGTQFRGWLARLLVSHLKAGSEGSEKPQ